MVRIYLDVCSLNRPFDNRSQDRVRLEAEAIGLILDRIVDGEMAWIGSDVLMYEIERNSDPVRRFRVRSSTALVHDVIEADETDTVRAGELVAMGFHALDAMHLACAERGRVDALLTTDDHMLRVASRQSNRIHLRVVNPLSWLSGMADP